MSAELWPDVLVVGVPAFAAGTVVGYHVRRIPALLLTSRKEAPMPPSSYAPRWYLTYMALIGTAAILALVLAVNGIYTNGRQDAAAQAANKARDQQNSQLLSCFDRYAAASASTSQAVREASVAVSQTTVVRDRVLGNAAQLFGKALIGRASEPELRDVLSRLGAASSALDVAQGRLARVRTLNPVPDPPSQFCDAD